MSVLISSNPISLTECNVDFLNESEKSTRLNGHSDKITIGLRHLVYGFGCEIFNQPHGCVNAYEHSEGCNS